MVYIDPRDRKFQLIVILPIVVVGIIMVLALTDGSTEVELVAVVMGIVAVVFFLIYLVTQVVLERVRG